MKAVAFALTSVALTVLFGCENNRSGPPVEVKPEALYSQMCARCHGADGKGDPEMRKTMPVRDFTDPAWRATAKPENLERVIMAGSNLMPAFGGTISATKLSHLAGYVLKLGEKRP